MASIYELGQGFKILINMIESETIDDDVITDAWENQTIALAEKGENVAKYMKIVDGEIAVIDEEIKRLQALKKTKQNGKERIKALMQNAMETAGEKKLACGTFTLSIQANPPKVVLDVTDINAIPKEYLTIPEPEVNKAKLKDSLKAGYECEWAHLESGTSLRIR